MGVCVFLAKMEGFESIIVLLRFIAQQADVHRTSAFFSVQTPPSIHIKTANTPLWVLAVFGGDGGI